MRNDPMSGGKKPSVIGISINLLNLPGIGPALKKLLGGFGVDNKRCEDCEYCTSTKGVYWFPHTAFCTRKIDVKDITGRKYEDIEEARKECAGKEYKRKWWLWWRPK